MSAKSWARRQDWILWGALGCVLVGTAHAEYTLARATGVHELIAAAVPGALDLYVIRALQVRRDVFMSVAVMVAVNVTSHLVSASVLPMHWSIISAVGALAPLILWRVHTLWYRRSRTRDEILWNEPAPADKCDGCEHRAHHANDDPACTAPDCMCGHPVPKPDAVSAPEPFVCSRGHVDCHTPVSCTYGPDALGDASEVPPFMHTLNLPEWGQCPRCWQFYPESAGHTDCPRNEDAEIDVAELGGYTHDQLMDVADELTEKYANATELPPYEDMEPDEELFAKVRDLYEDARANGKKRPPQRAIVAECKVGWPKAKELQKRFDREFGVK